MVSGFITQSPTGEAFRTHELRQRVILAGTDGADVVLRVARVDSSSRVHELRDRARGLHRGDGHRALMPSLPPIQRSP